MRLVLDRKCSSSPTAAVGRCPQQPTRCQTRCLSKPQLQISYARTRLAVHTEPRAHTPLSTHAVPVKQSEQTVDGGCDQESTLPDDQSDVRSSTGLWCACVRCATKRKTVCILQLHLQDQSFQLSFGTFPVCCYWSTMVDAQAITNANLSPNKAFSTSEPESCSHALRHDYA